MTSAFGYPVALDLRGRKAVIIGGGSVAERRAHALVDGGAREVVVIADELTQGLEGLAASGHVRVVRRKYRRGDLDGAFIALAATDDPAANAAAFAEAEERCVLFNAADDVPNCHFAVPSIVRRGDFVVSISTGGRAPALSKRVRQELEAQFGPEYAELVDLLAAARADALGEREKLDFDSWASRWSKALDGDLATLVRDGGSQQVAEIVRDALLCPASRDSPATGTKTGRVSVVGAGPGDPGLITVRGRELLDAADVIVHDRLVDPSLVEGRPSIYVGKEPGAHAASQHEINQLLVGLARQGRHVVRLKGGDPFVFGRGSEECEVLADAGIEFEVVPAPTSAIAALAAAGIPVTDRRFGSSVAIVTGHCAIEGDAPDWAKLAGAVDTIVVLMGVSAMPEIVRGLLDGGLEPDLPAAIVENGTTADQRVLVSTAGQLVRDAGAAGVRAPAVIVFGEVVRVRERLTSAVGGGLDAVELGVLAAARDEVLVRADLDDARPVEHDDQVRHPHRAEPM